MGQLEILAPVTEEEKAQLTYLEQGIERERETAFRSFNTIGDLLRDIRDRNLYKLSHGTFEEYCEERWEWTNRHINRFIAAAQVYNNLGPIGPILPSSESQVRPLAQLESPAEQGEVWRRVVDLAQQDGGRITAKMVESEKARFIAEKNKAYYTLAEWEALDAIGRGHLLAATGSKTFNRTNDNVEWASWTWNPVTGCEHGCAYCYARDIAVRFYPQDFEPSFYPERLTAPSNTTVPRSDSIGDRNVFVCSMADLFGDWVPREWIDAVLAQVGAHPEWTFVFLTKNPGRLVGIEWPDNAWVGTTVDRQSRVADAEDAFARISANVKFLSCEPLTEALEFSRLDVFDWVIIGGWSPGTKSEHGPVEWAWVESLLWQARRADCMAYFKPNLDARPQEFPV